VCIYIRYRPPQRLSAARTGVEVQVAEMLIPFCSPNLTSATNMDKAAYEVYRTAFGWKCLISRRLTS
jgi:hypothetical protein